MFHNTEKLELNHLWKSHEYITAIKGLRMVQSAKHKSETNEVIISNILDLICISQYPKTFVKALCVYMKIEKVYGVGLCYFFEINENVERFNELIEVRNKNERLQNHSLKNFYSEVEKAIKAEVKRRKEDAYWTLKLINNKESSSDDDQDFYRPGM